VLHHFLASILSILQELDLPLISDKENQESLMVLSTASRKLLLRTAHQVSTEVSVSLSLVSSVTEQVTSAYSILVK